MKPRGLAVAWGVVVVTILLVLGYELAHWRDLSTRSVRAADERQRLTSEIRLRAEQLVAEMRAHSALLQDLQWASAEGDPSAFLTRLAELAREKRMRITAIGPLERQTTAQFDKSWHAVQVVAPYREIRALAGRVEHEGGILEELRLERAAPPLAGGPADAGEVQARFRLTALELSVPAKRILDRVLAAGSRAPSRPGRGAPPALSGAGAESPLTRDPFVFVLGQVPAARGKVGAPQPGKPSATAPGAGPAPIRK